MLFKTAIVQIIVWIRITNAYGLWHSFFVLYESCAQVFRSTRFRQERRQNIFQGRSSAGIFLFILKVKSKNAARPARKYGQTKKISEAGGGSLPNSAGAPGSRLLLSSLYVIVKIHTCASM